MTTPTTDPADTDSTVLKTGADAVSKEKYSKEWNSDGTTASSETWVGDEDRANEYYDEKKGASNLANLRLDVEKAKGTVVLNYNNDEDEDDQEDDSIPEWDINPVKIMRPLAAHPYWQREYAPTAGYDINREMARMDVLIAQGEPYSGDGFYDDFTSKYYYLRAAGVINYPALGIEIRKTFTTSSTSSVSDSFSNIGRVQAIEDIGPPTLVEAAMSAIEQISGYGSADPDSAVFTAGAWEFAKEPTVLNLSGNADSTIVRIEETWIGLDRWSKVIYPGGTWNPPQTT